MAHEVAFSIGSVNIHWYGLAWAFATLLIRQLPLLFSFKNERIRTHWYDLVDWGIISVILGGRLGWLLFYYPKGLLSIKAMTAVWQGGMSFHGGLISGLIFLYVFCRRKGLPLLDTVDSFTLWMPLCIACVRFANFVNGELWGRVTTVPWGMVFPKADMLLRHPSQIYEAFGEGILLWCLLWYMKDRLHIPGQLTAFAITVYGIVRFIIETYFREPSFEMLSWMSTGAILCLAMIVAGSGMFYQLTLKNKVDA